MITNMEIPKNYLTALKERKTLYEFTSERQELIQRFVDKINLERVGTKWKPVTARQINVLLSFLKVKDLYWLFGECERAPSFSKKFFGKLRDTKVTPPRRGHSRVRQRTDSSSGEKAGIQWTKKILDSCLRRNDNQRT